LVRGDGSFSGQSVVVLDFVLIEVCDQAFSIGTSCVLLAAAVREKRAVPDLRTELL
jgi:hypothetical protein